MSDKPPVRQLFDDLSSAAKKLAQVPRIGRLIGWMSTKQRKKLSETATEAEVFWEVYNYDTVGDDDDCGLLADGLKAAPRLGWRGNGEPLRSHQVQRARDMLGAIAFEMLSKTDQDGKPAPWWNGVDSNLESFKLAVFRRFVAAGAMIQPSGEAEEDKNDFFTDWNDLLRMDSHRLQHFMFSTDARDQKLRWTDRTTMTFFAAYWACRWATPKELKQTRHWVIDPLKKTNEEFREFWEFAVEMPEEAIGCKQQWIDLFSPLYDASFRSTEFVYRSWKRMEGWNAEPCKKFIEEFELIRSGKHSLEQKQIANAMMAEDAFVSVAGGMHRYCVTNLEYELFDARHKNNRWYSGEHPSVKEADATADDRCPVVVVTWYDAWCFAKWVGCCLPTEAGWEYACRAGSTGRYCFGDGKEKLSGYAWFYGNAESRTHPVGQKKANVWGLYDMHGNVWEWCQDFYASRGRVRVIRGGSWYNYAACCTAGYRNCRAPSNRHYGLGFRVARVPSGAVQER